ncbi:MAG: hypothetical protein FWE14_09070 [Lachnospiraceae bacterium]|nr:hypothetical protein [Lachnospiraceae bacterium]
MKMNKKLLQIISLIICLVLIQPITIFAESKEHLHNDSCCQNGYDIDELLTLMNAGIIKPNKTITVTSAVIPSSIIETDEVYIPISPSNLLCVIAHSWGSWNAWKEYKRTHRPNDQHCIVDLYRTRTCTRNNCGISQIEYTWALIICCRP